MTQNEQSQFPQDRIDEEYKDDSCNPKHSANTRCVASWVPDANFFNINLGFFEQAISREVMAIGAAATAAYSDLADAC